MHKVQLRLLLSIMMVIIISACYQDSILEETITDSFLPSQTFLYEIKGRVVDSDGQPINRAILNINDQYFFTDDQGLFSMSEIEISESGIFLSAKKENYIDGGIRLYPSSSLQHKVNITLSNRSTEYFFNNSATTEIQDPSGVILHIASNTFFQNDVLYQGIVKMRIHWLDLSSISSIKTGLQVYESITDDETRLFNKLSFLSIVYISVTDDKGEVLKIPPGNSVVVDFPVPYELLDPTVGTVSLVSFEESKGLWVKEGDAIFDNSGYKAELSHFSWWAVANIQPASKLCIDFESQYSRSEVQFFTITKIDGSLVHFGTVDYNSELYIPIPTSTTLEITVYNSCTTIIQQVNYAGTSLQKNTLRIDLVDTNELTTVKGIIIDCNGLPYRKPVQISYSSDRSQDNLGMYTDAFEIELNHCPDTNEIFIKAADNTAELFGTASIKFEEGLNIYNITIQLCEDGKREGVLLLGSEIFENVTARKNPEETLIIIPTMSSASILIGIDGFSEGEFIARLFERGNTCEGKVIITDYGEIGSSIIGTLEMQKGANCPGYIGSFNAIREK